MRQILSFLIFLAAGFAGGYGAAKWKAVERLSAKLSHSQNASVLVAFAPTPYPIEDLPFCIVISGRNNGAHLEKTLRSAFSQKYDNYRIVYVDDASDDGSFDLARDLMYASPRFGIAQILRNERPLGPLACLAQAAKSCGEDEILVVLNGEDWLAHEWVLARLNEYYADPDLWMTYGQSRDYPAYRTGGAYPVQETGKGVRAQPFGATHLKTFYAKLFKKIQASDFLYKGEFFPAACDLAYMFPMLEMAKGHAQCLPDILYICNREAKGDDRELHAVFEKHIRALAPYPQLSSLDLQTAEEAR